MHPYELVRVNIQHCSGYIKREAIIKDLTELINKYSLENDSNTPDFILAEYLFDCLISSTILISSRSIWYNPSGYIGGGEEDASSGN